MSVLYTDRYFGECSTDFRARDCVFYLARCMDGSDMLRGLLTEMRQDDAAGKVLFAGLSEYDNRQVMEVFGDVTLAENTRRDIIALSESAGTLYGGYRLVKLGESDWEYYWRTGKERQTESDWEYYWRTGKERQA